MASPNLLALAAAEHENAKRHLFKLVPLCHLGAAILVLAALFTPLPWAYFIAVVVLAAQALSWTLRARGVGLHRIAEEARRRALLVDALGEHAERLDVANIRAAISKRACRTASQAEGKTYWASQLPQGVARLLNAMQESAFWSKHLYDAASRTMFRILGAVVLALALLTLVGFVAFSGDTNLAVARVIVVALSSLIGLDILGQARAWRTAAAEAERVDRRLEQIDETSIDPMLAVVADYAVATAGAPPIPDRIYRAEKERLEELWREHRATPAKLTTPFERTN